MTNPAINKKLAYVFDLDQTLVTTEARIHVYKNGVHVGEMNSKEYNSYKHNPKDTLDFSDFEDPEFILKAKKYKAWPIIYNISKAVKETRSTSDVYILTARSNAVKSTIYEFLKQNGVEISLNHIITIGDNTGDIDISTEKHKWLTKISLKYDEILFFDDDPKNIEIAQSVNKVKTKLIEDMGGVGAPMATVTNTSGMGNVSPGGSGSMGSGDKWGNTLGGKPYTQGKPLKKKRKKKKIVKENLTEKFNEIGDPISDMGIGRKQKYDKEVQDWVAEMSYSLPGTMYRYLANTESLELYNKVKFERYNIKIIIWSEKLDPYYNITHSVSDTWFEANIKTRYLDKGWELFKEHDNIYAVEFLLIKPPSIKENIDEKFEEKSDPLKDMGIGITGLWDYTPEDAADEIWSIMRQDVHSLIANSRRSGKTYTISPLQITCIGCSRLAFEPNVETIQYLAKLVQEEIDKEIKSGLIDIKGSAFYRPNIRYQRISESNINPYDKIGMAMAKRMKIKPPFKKKKNKTNQNAVVQQKFEHEIITLEQFQNTLNENK